jgi:8-oxo-dGTP diphosphatase
MLSRLQGIIGAQIVFNITFYGGTIMFIVNVEGAIFKNDTWLIIERSKKEEHAGGMLSLVGGKTEVEGNTLDILERTVKREIYEEVDVKVKEHLNYVHSTSFVTDSGENVIDIVFLCEYESGEAIAKSPDEVESVNWMTVQQIYSHPNAPDYLKESIKRAENLKGTNRFW